VEVAIRDGLGYVSVCRSVDFQVRTSAALVNASRTGMLEYSYPMGKKQCKQVKSRLQCLTKMYSRCTMNYQRIWEWDPCACPSEILSSVPR
jgi:hypothetical protein